MARESLCQQDGKKVIVAHARRLHGYDYEGVSPQGSKPVRAKPLAGQAKLGNVRLIEAPWNLTFLNEFATFPNSKFKDQVDACGIAYAEVALGAAPTIEVYRTGF